MVEGARGSRGIAKPLASASKGGAYPVDRTVLPTFLSKVRAKHRGVGDRTSALREGGHRSGTVPESHRLRDHAAWFWVASRRVAQAHPDAAGRPPDKRPISAACDDAGLASARRLPPPGEVKDMVEHRWLRAIGPGVIALGAVVAIGSSTQAARDRPWPPLACDGRCRFEGGGRPGDEPRDPRRSRHRRLDATRPDAGCGRRPDRPAPGDGHPRTRIGEGHGAAGRVIRRRAVRPPAAGRGRRRRGVPAVHDRRRRPAAPRPSPRSPTSSGAPRSTRPATCSSRAASTGRRVRTSASGDARSTDPARRRACSTRSRRTRGSGGRGRPSSPGRSRATDSRSSPAARRRVGRASSNRRRSAGRSASSPTRPSARCSGWPGERLDHLRGLSRAPLPDLVGGCRVGRPGAAHRCRRPGHARRRRPGRPAGPRMGRSRPAGGCDRSRPTDAS